MWCGGSCMDISASPARHLHIRKRIGASEVEPDFSRMCSQGFSFYWVCGWRRVRSTPLLRPQPPATVRNRLRWGRYGRTYSKFCKRDQFWRFPPFCVAGAILSRRFQKLICNFRGRRTTSEVSCCVFFMTPLSGLRGVDTRCKFRGRYGILCMRCDENWRKPRTKHWFWGSTCLKFMSKLVGKRRFWSYKVWNLEEVSHEMLMLPRVSSRVSGFPVASLRLWGKLQNLSFSKVAKHLVMSFCRRGTCLHSSLSAIAWNAFVCVASLQTCSRAWCEF